MDGSTSLADRGRERLALGVGQARAEGGQERRFRGRRGDHPLELLDGPPEDDRRGRSARGQAVVDVADVGVEYVGIGRQAGSEMVEGALGVDGHEAGQVAGQRSAARRAGRPIRTRRGAGRPVRDGPWRRLEHVQRDAVLDRQRLTVDIGDRAPSASVTRRVVAGSPGRAWIVRAVVVALVAEHRGVDRLALQEPLPEAVGEVDRRCARRRRSSAPLRSCRLLQPKSGSCSPPRSISGSSPSRAPGRRGRRPRGRPADAGGRP